ncbi:MAG: 4Fe-4S dicluster domain-containing protein [Elusimicrobia bacterium]|nr:4Fe-4S dicluster domain-containing protein [Elusimicrobiota bacterium]
MTRRRMLLQSAAAATGFGALLSLMRCGESVPASRVPPDLVRRGLLRPPGAAEESEFLARCIRCQRCAEACETDAILLAPRAAGRTAHTPYIIAETSACDLCLACGKACPTRALKPLRSMSDARMGTAVVDKRLCVSHNGTGVCGACFTICPLKGKAITQGKHNAPEVHDDSCAGCGLCEEACIVRDQKDGRAIRVRSSRSWS